VIGLDGLSKYDGTGESERNGIYSLYAGVEVDAEELVVELAQLAWKIKTVLGQ
jgi:hypothetical protein